MASCFYFQHLFYAPYDPNYTSELFCVFFVFYAALLQQFPELCCPYFRNLLSYFHRVVYRSIVCTLRVSTVLFINQDIKYFFPTYLTISVVWCTVIISSIIFMSTMSMSQGGELLLFPLQMDIPQGPHRPPILPPALPLSPQFCRIPSGGRICAFTWVIFTHCLIKEYL